MTNDNRSELNEMKKTIDRIDSRLEEITSILKDTSQRAIEEQRQRTETEQLLLREQKQTSNTLALIQTQLANLPTRLRDDQPTITLADGTKEWRNTDGQLHRVDGPAIIRSNGTLEYYLNDEHHRIGGPAIIRQDGTEQYYLHGQLHRIGGPAIIEPNGSKEYWVDGKLHRENGPAVINPDGSEEYWLHGVRQDK